MITALIHAMKIENFHRIRAVQLIKLRNNVSGSGELVVMEGMSQIPFAIARVFVVRGSKGGSERGQHAHKLCTQFLTCSYGSVKVHCDDGQKKEDFILDSLDVGLLIPPGIWVQQTYSVADSVLTVLCDRPYEAGDYIRNYVDFIASRNTVNE